MVNHSCILRIIGILLFFTLCSCTVFAQSKKQCTYISPNKKAVKLYTKAKKVYKDKGNYKESKKLFLEAVKEDSLYIRVYKELGNIAWRRKDYATVTSAFRKYIRLCENAKSDYYYKLGKAFYLSDNYKAAIEALDEYTLLGEIPQNKEDEAVGLIVRA